jgi:hypothetical protein
MGRALTIARPRVLLALLAAFLLMGLSTAACSGNRNVSVGGSIHRTSGGGWGHSIGIGIHSHGKR